MGLSYMGSKCLFVTRVNGFRRLPIPPARTTPFISAILQVFPSLDRLRVPALRSPQPVAPCVESHPISTFARYWLRFPDQTAAACLPPSEIDTDPSTTDSPREHLQPQFPRRLEPAYTAQNVLQPAFRVAAQWTD